MCVWTVLSCYLDPPTAQGYLLALLLGDGQMRMLALPTPATRELRVAAQGIRDRMRGSQLIVRAQF